MKNALIISYFFPPIISSGVNRTLGFANCLKDFGWHPKILTVSKCRDPWELSGDDFDNTPHEVVRRPEMNLSYWPDRLHAAWSRGLKMFRREASANRLRELVCYPDQQASWRFRSTAIAMARDCQVIYVSCRPYSSAVTACRVKVETGTPLVVDFRDPWMQGSNVLTRESRRIVRAKLALEFKVISICDRLIVNTPDAAVMYKQAYPAYASKILCIPNGFDALNIPSESDRPDHFRIVHCGKFYGTRTPKRLLQALEGLDVENAEFVHVGPELDELSKYSGKTKITQTGSVDHKTAQRIIRTASLLFLCQGFGHPTERYTAVAAKTFEYLATGLPILAEVPPGDNADIVSEYCSLPLVITEPSADQMRELLQGKIAHLHDWRPRVSEKFIDRYSRRALTGALAGVFDAVVDCPDESIKAKIAHHATVTKPLRDK